MTKTNKALHPTAIPLRFIAAGELGRYQPVITNIPQPNYSQLQLEIYLITRILIF
jgi:hypothetical protein